MLALQAEELLRRLVAIRQLAEADGVNHGLRAKTGIDMSLRGINYFKSGAIEII